MPHLTRQEIEAFEPDALPDCGVSALEQARRAIETAGFWNANQQMGRRWPIGCVALEITQRCNLDCTLCYLSANSEAAHDLPLEEVFRRIDLIHSYYGRNTDVQITGGDPTLRKRDELVAIVRRVRSLGMRSTLMTNGVRATRALLQELAAAGLVDVSFHVDTTQRRIGYASEVDLNALRQTYIERAKGLPLSVSFSTTVHAGNFHEIPELVRFLKDHAGAVRTASFQLAADTGRGVEGARGFAITPETVARQIEAGAGSSINFNASLIGHPACSRHGLCLEAGGKLFDAFDDTDFIRRILSATAHLELERNDAMGVATRIVRWLAANPAYLLPVLKWAGNKAWQMRRSVVAARGRVRTIAFVIHDFMDSHALDSDRIRACVFKAMNADGPVSMCMHNAKRDRIILQPIRIHTAQGARYWQPLTGETTPNCETPGEIAPERHSPKHLKGLARQRFIAQQRA